jgi:hypothetical protein
MRPASFRTRLCTTPRCPECDRKREILRSSEFSEFSTRSKHGLRLLTLIFCVARTGRALAASPRELCKRGRISQTAPATGPVLLRLIWSAPEQTIGTKTRD